MSISEIRITWEELKGWVIRYGLVQAEALEKPYDYDNCDTLNRLACILEDINNRIASFDNKPCPVYDQDSNQILAVHDQLPGTEP